MALKASLSWQDYRKLPAEQQRMYHARGNVCVLDVEPVGDWALDMPGKLRNGLQTERKRNEQARKAAEVLGEIDPRAAVDAYNRVAELERQLRAGGQAGGAAPGAGAAQGNDHMLEQARAKFQAELRKVSEERDRYRGELISRGLRDELRATLRQVAPDTQNIDDIVEIMYPHVEKRTQADYNGSGLTYRVVGRDGEPEISGKPGSTDAKQFAELIGEMRTDGPFKALFAKPGAEGFRGRTSPQPAGGRARTASGSDDTSQPERLSPMDKLKAANEAAAAGHTSGGVR